MIALAFPGNGGGLGESGLISDSPDAACMFGPRSEPSAIAPRLKRPVFVRNSRRVIARAC
jgi:hypothetical protein